MRPTLRIELSLLPFASALAMVLAFTLAGAGCTTVRQLREPVSVPATGKAERTRSKHALDYSVALNIAAPPTRVWQLLTDAAGHARWNSTLIKLEGNIALGGQVRLVAKVAPRRTFKLKVTTADAPRRLVWEDGGSLFLGVRTYTLSPGPSGGTIFTMSETFSGGMLGMIEGSLPDFGPSFETFAADLKREAEKPALP